MTTKLENLLKDLTDDDRAAVIAEMDEELEDAVDIYADEKSAEFEEMTVKELTATLKELAAIYPEAKVSQKNKTLLIEELMKWTLREFADGYRSGQEMEYAAAHPELTGDDEAVQPVIEPEATEIEVPAAVEPEISAEDALLNFLTAQEIRLTNLVTAELTEELRAMIKKNHPDGKLNHPNKKAIIDEILRLLEIDFLTPPAPAAVDKPKKAKKEKKAAATAEKTPVDIEKLLADLEVARAAKNAKLAKKIRSTLRRGGYYISRQAD